MEKEENMTKKELPATADLTLLGQGKTVYPNAYAPQLLETFRNKNPQNDYWVRFFAPEFTALCPLTGQPDFAKIYLAYIPGVKMVESKSLKLYLFSFRNHGAFHEECVNLIAADLIKLLRPKYLEILGVFTPRGGIEIHPFVNYGKKNSKWTEVAASRLERFSLLPFAGPDNN